MFLTRFGLSRPVVVRMALILIVVFGLYSFNTMNRFLDPDITIGEGVVYTLPIRLLAKTVDRRSRYSRHTLVENHRQNFRHRRGGGGATFGLSTTFFTLSRDTGSRMIL